MYKDDPRIEKINNLLLKYTMGDFTARETLSEQGDELDAIIAGLNTLGEEAQASRNLIRDYEKRVNILMQILLKYTLFDFSEKVEVSGINDELDAIAVGLNTLGEELEAKIMAEKKYIHDLEKFAEVLETTADAVTTITPEGVFTSWNKAAERIYGYTSEEMIGQYAFGDFSPEKEREPIRQAIATARRGKQTIDFQTERIRKDGKLICVSITITPIFNKDGEVVSISNISRDITAQKKAEERLKESMEQVETILSNAPNAVVVIDEAGKVVKWNSKSETIFGWKTREALNRSMHELIMPQQHSQAHHAGLKRFIETGTGSVVNKVIEITAIDKYKKEFPIELGISATKSKGKYLFIAFINDITERKKSEKRIKELNQELYKNISQLEISNKELEAFTYSVSHDLRAPLRAIHGYTKIIMQDYIEKLDEEAITMISSVSANAKKMGQLIDDLLAFSRLGRKEVQKQEVDMTRVVKDILQELGEVNAKITLYSLPAIRADKNLITQVLLNLISNAIKYSSLKEHPVIEIGSTQLQHEVTYYVKDNGSGFDMAYYNKLFGVFQRLHDPSEYEGTGVGLAIVKRIIEKHGGRVWAESEPGKGAAFYFSLKNQ